MKSETILGHWGWYLEGKLDTWAWSGRRQGQIGKQKNKLEPTWTNWTLHLSFTTSIFDDEGFSCRRGWCPAPQSCISTYPRTQRSRRGNLVRLDQMWFGCLMSCKSRCTSKMSHEFRDTTCGWNCAWISTLLFRPVSYFNHHPPRRPQILHTFLMVNCHLLQCREEHSMERISA